MDRPDMEFALSPSTYDCIGIVIQVRTQYMRSLAFTNIYLIVLA